MTDAGEDLLTTTEGVDEGSAASTAEGGPTSTEQLAGVPDPQTRSLGDPNGQDEEADPAPPVDMETDESRAAREARGTGQQLDAGEG